MIKKFGLLIVLFIFLSSHVYGRDHLEPMKKNILTIIINKPIEKVFEFTTNPKNTPKWVDGIEVEKTNEWPPKPGTIYKNRNQSGQWSVYKVSKYEPNKEFELVKQDDSTYHVNYLYTAYSNGKTKLIYQEWVTKGEINDLFTQATLNKLKTMMERE